MRSIQSHLCQEVMHEISRITKHIREVTGSQTVASKSYLRTQLSACCSGIQKTFNYSRCNGTNISPREAERLYEPDLSFSENRWDSEGGHLPMNYDGVIDAKK